MKNFYTKYVFSIFFLLIPFFSNAQSWELHYKTASELYKKKQYRKAILELSFAEQKVSKQLGKFDLNTMKIYLLSGKIYEQVKEYKNAITDYNMVENILKQNKQYTQTAYRDVLVKLGTIHFLLKRYRAADDYLKKGMRLIGEFEGKENKKYLETYILLAKLYKIVNKYSVAENYYTDILALIEKKYRKEEYYYSVALQYAHLLLKKGEKKKAANLYQAYFHFIKKKEKDPKADLPNYKNMFRSMEEDYQKLFPMVKEYLYRLEKNPKYKQLFITEIDSAIHFFKKEEQFASAENLLVLKIKKSNTPQLTDILLLTDIYLKLNKLEKAKQLIKERIEKISPKKNLAYAKLKTMEGKIYEKEGNLIEAEKSWETSMEVINTLNLRPKQYPIEEYNLLFEAYYREKKLEKAKEYIFQLKEIAKKYPRGHYINGVIKEKESKIWVENKKFMEAGKALEEKMKIFAAFYGKGDEKYGNSVLEVANFYLKQNNLEKAKIFYLECMNVYKRIEGIKGKKYNYVKDIFEEKYK